MVSREPSGRILAQATPAGARQSRAIAARRTIVQIPDLAETRRPHGRSRSPRAASSLAASAPYCLCRLRKDETLLGYIAAYRQEVRPFSDKQIALLQNFAAQAVIAMENARLITETREALEQQTATAEVLQVINSSPGDLAPVFDAMLEKAMRLCEAASGMLLIYDGDVFRLVAAWRAGPFANLLREPFEPHAGARRRRAAQRRTVVQIADITDDDALNRTIRCREPVVELGDTDRCSSCRSQGRGLLGFSRLSARGPAVHRQADRAVAELRRAGVIAMENARLITETREALEQQTATAEVLGVINSSPGDLAPVFDAMLEKAMRLCEAASGNLEPMTASGFAPPRHLGIPRRICRVQEKQSRSNYGLGTDLPSPHPCRGSDRKSVLRRFLKPNRLYQSGESASAGRLVDLGGARSNLACGSEEGRRRPWLHRILPSGGAAVFGQAGRIV